MKILHAADLHMDSPLRGLSLYDGAPVDRIRSATRRATENMVATAIDRQVDLVVIAGDVFDGDWRDYGTGLFWVEQLARLDDADIPVVVVAGNHDAASEISRNLTLPSNVTQLAADRPERKVFDDLEVEVIGRSYMTRSVTEDLTATFPQGDPHLFSIGLLHTSLDGRPGHADYAPSSVDGLRSLGYQYWALGHVHNREVVHEDPWIVFPGNVQGRHIRETGPKGASIVEVEDRRVRSVTPVELDVMRWAHLEVPIDGASDLDDVVSRLMTGFGDLVGDLDGRPGAVRVVMTGRGGVHELLWDDPHRFEAEVRSAAVRTGDLWVEKVKVSTSPAIDRSTLASNETLARLLEHVENLRNDPALLEGYEELFSELRRKVGADVRVPEDHSFDPRRIGTAEHLEGLLDDALETVLAAIAKEQR